MRKIELLTNSGSTVVSVPSSLEDLSDSFHPESTIILIDENVYLFHGSKLESFRSVIIKEGEDAKTLGYVSEIYGQLIENEIDRHYTLIGIGGGITTDLSGFIGSTYLRGLNFGFVSTTLLGQVDAAIGGKNGLNFNGYKNMIGVIRQPGFVMCDTGSLKTLPKNEFIGGFSEIIKYALIRKADFFDYLEGNISKAMQFSNDELEYMIFESILTKKEIVENDERESGERRLLNLGHTFAHALEKNYGIPHGEAVAIGIMFAAKLSSNMGMLRMHEVDRIERLLTSAGLPVSISFDPETMVETMKMDKKRQGKFVHFILLEEIGKAIIKEIPVSELIQVFNDLR